MTEQAKSQSDDWWATHGMALTQGTLLQPNLAVQGGAGRSHVLDQRAAVVASVGTWGHPSTHVHPRRVPIEAKTIAKSGAAINLDLRRAASAVFGSTIRGVQKVPLHGADITERSNLKSESISNLLCQLRCVVSHRTPIPGLTAALALEADTRR